MLIGQPTSVLRIAVDSSLMSTARLICTPPKASAVRLMSLGTTRSVWGAGEALLGSPTKELVIAWILMTTIGMKLNPLNFLDRFRIHTVWTTVKFIAVTVDRSDVSMICWCSFTGVNVPSSISLADYSPVGTAAYDDVPTGSVVFADGDTDYQCYTYNVSYFS